MWIVTGTIAVCHRANGRGGEGMKGERLGKMTNFGWRRIVGEKGSGIFLSMVLITICMACLSANASLDKEEIALKSVKKAEAPAYFEYDVIQGDMPEPEVHKPKPRPRDSEVPGTFNILKHKRIEDCQVKSSEYGLNGWSKSLVQEVIDQNLLYLAVYNLDMRNRIHAVATLFEEEVPNLHIADIASFVLSSQKDKAIQFGSTIFHMKFIHTDCYAATGIAQTNKGQNLTMFAAAAPKSDNAAFIVIGITDTSLDEGQCESSVARLTDCFPLEPSRPRSFVVEDESNASYTPIIRTDSKTK
ncbi:DgyrCDS8406 [Dimorphilus gyrociliatus]|uniref:DgyrCDS8406 n=1 Tax=Dimorphilus gyrociliatus TaxID=2664684 RepID=A0A7I8VWD8_9ANNE|nr:DgyrCDS8406 [Dimorphilus gyrociliatus]